MSMTDSELSMLASCINQDPFTQEQIDFLDQWWLIVTEEQVESFNSELPELYLIRARETTEGEQVIPIAILTDQTLYEPILEELNYLEKIKLARTDFSQR